MSVDSFQHLAIAVALAILHTPIATSPPHPEAEPELTIASAMVSSSGDASNSEPPGVDDSQARFEPPEEVDRIDFLEAEQRDIRQQRKQEFRTSS